MTISQAKKHLTSICWGQEGFVGVGVTRLGNKDALKVYVADRGAPVVQQLSRDGEFEGFPVEIEVSGKVHAF